MLRVIRAERGTQWNARIVLWATAVTHLRCIYRFSFLFRYPVRVGAFGDFDELQHLWAVVDTRAGLWVTRKRAKYPGTFNVLAINSILEITADKLCHVFLGILFGL